MMLQEHDLTLMHRLIDRAQYLARELDEPVPGRISLLLDLGVAHKRYEIDLLFLLNADPADFMHDVWGIMDHVDRKTGLMHEDGFVPRFAKLLQ